ncbi:MAG: bifunctional folylpolyglutamate synthase/dihydrofolate synthase [Solirubrobacterales bacterium]
MAPAGPVAASTAEWSAERGEEYLHSLAPLGWKFGLERIRKLVSALGMPQHRFASVHVVGTNGKSSVTEATAALLEAHGLRAGAYLSPHDERWSERIRIGGAEVPPAEFAAAVERVSQAVEAVDRTLEDAADRVTQFEAATATAFVALAAAGVEVAVIEAGLGGRLDATNVLPSRVTALTSVGLEHTQWLGETEDEIAGEKLAVLRDHSTLVVGRLSDESMAVAERVAAERNAGLIKIRDLADAVELRSGAPYARRNFAVALACTDIVVGELDLERVAEVAGELELHGRAEVLDTDPPMVLDAAHNPAGAEALAEALPVLADGRPVIACAAVLADKDERGFVAGLAPALNALVATEVPAERLERAGRPGTRSLPAETLARAAGAADVEAIVEAEPAAAVARSRALAAERGGVALICGSHYLLRYAGSD